MVGYPGTVHKSPWATFKSKKSGGWTIGVSNNQGNANSQLLAEGFKAEAAASGGKVKKIISLTANPPNDVTTQLQQMRSLLERKVDIILSTLSSPTALNSVIDQAAKQGVPVISIQGQSTSRNAINIQPNPTLFGYQGARGLVTQMGGKGSVFIVDAIPGISIDTQILGAAKRVFEACGLQIVGQVEGFFDPAKAKTETLQFLATHPQQIDGVFQLFNMTMGVISAFQQSGRTVPPVSDIGANKASMAYWRDNASSGYKGTAVGSPTIGIGRYVMATALAVLEGRGPRSTDMAHAPIPIDDSNRARWTDPSWTTATQGISEGPPNVIPVKALVNGFFTR